MDDDTPSAPITGFGWHGPLLLLTALLGAAVLAGLVITLTGANRQRDRALAWQSHSFEVMLLARTLSGTIARAEASLGRYVISGDRQLGVIYGDEWRDADTQITALEALAGDNVAQRASISRLRAAYKERSDELAVVALSTRYGKNDQALSRYYRARNAPSLKALNNLMGEIIAHERQLLVDRTDEARRLVDRASDVARVLAVFGLLIVLGAIALGWMTIAALAQRRVAENEADAERERAFELQAAVSAATAELERQAAERAAAEEKLRQGQKMEAVGQLTGGIAHDFNNMLAVVLGGLELARRKMSARHPALRHIDNATDGANRAAALTRQLLAFSRADALLPAAIEPGELIAGMADLLDRTLGDAITVVTHGHSGDWRVWVDRHQLENAVLNLAVNARDAMDGRGTLSIALGGRPLIANEVEHCAAGDYVTITVSDTGCGMAPDVLARVFEPFFTTKPVGRGTGLGLSQIFGFVRQSSGEIAISSTPNGGTSVTIFLPRYIGETENDAQPGQIPAPTSPHHDHPQGLRILVVEDDPRVMATTMAGLGALGHHPTSCADPLAAPALVNNGPGFDLIISDVLMPGQTGPEMIAALRPAHPLLAVLFVTGFAGDAGASAELGDNVVLHKPFTLATLDAAIANAMAASRPKAASTRPADRAPMIATA